MTGLRFEPSARPPATARRVAAFFLFVSLVGALPGLYGLVCYMFLAPGAFASVVGIPIWLAGLAVIALGFGQLRFYFKRVRRRVVRARFWWMSTYVYNLAATGISITLLFNDQHVGAFVATLWFGLLSALAIIAYVNEKPGEIARPDRLIPVLR